MLQYNFDSHMRDINPKWAYNNNVYILEHVGLHTIKYSKHQYIRRMIKEFDDKLWQEDLEKRLINTLYRKYKDCIRDEQDLYENSAATTTLFGGNTGTLKLNISIRHTDDHTHCELCNTNAKEDI